MKNMFLFDSSNGVLSASFYVNQETFENETAIFSLDGTLHAEISGIPWGNVAIGDKFMVATQGLDGYLTVFNSDYEKKTYTATELFGASGYEFQAGSLAVTADGKLVVIGTRVDDQKVFVKTFNVELPVPGIVDKSTITGLNAKAGDAATITWAPVSGAAGYEVWINDLVNRTVVVRAQKVDGTTFVKPDGFQSGRYAIWVRAVGQYGQTGEWSAGITWDVVAKPPAVRFQNGLFTWSDLGASSYRVWVEKNNVGRQKVVDESTSNTSLSATLEPGSYQVWVKAGSSPWSTPLKFEVFANSIAPAVLNTLDTTPVVSWSSNPPAGLTVVSTEVWISLQGQRNAVYRATVLPAAGTSHEVAQVLARGLYQVWVRESYSNGARSLWGSGVVLNLADRPTLSLASGSGSLLSWTPFQLASQYELWVENSSGTRVAVGASLVSATTLDLASLALPAGSYRVWVRALGGLNSRWSFAVNATV